MDEDNECSSNIVLLADLNIDIWRSQPAWKSTMSLFGLHQLMRCATGKPSMPYTFTSYAVQQEQPNMPYTFTSYLHTIMNRQGGQRKRWEDNIREWTGLEFGKSQRAVENREKWRKLVAKSSLVPQ